MFEKAFIGPNQNIVGDSCDYGALAEAIIFYNEVTLVLHYGGFVDLVKFIGFDNFLRLLNETNIRIIFVKESIAPCRSTILFNFITFSAAGDDTFRISSNEDLIFYALENVKEQTRINRETANMISGKIKFIRTPDELKKGFGLPQLSQELVLDKDFTSRSLPEILDIIAPGYNLSNPLPYMGVKKVDKKLLFNSNINFNSLNALHKSAFQGKHRTYDSGSLLAIFAEFSENMMHSLNYGNSIITNPLQASLFKNKYCLLNSKETGSLEEITSFQSLTLDGKSIREVINSGGKDFSEVFSLYNEGRKFREWAGQIGDDKKLISEYIKSMSSLDRLDRWPAKTLRFLLTQIISSVNPLLGIAASFIDSFLIEKEWRPNLFIQGSVRDFVSL